jgi:hypothetical protein
LVNQSRWSEGLDPIEPDSIWPDYGPMAFGECKDSQGFFCESRKSHVFACGAPLGQYAGVYSLWASAFDRLAFFMRSSSAS